MSGEIKPKKMTVNVISGKDLMIGTEWFRAIPECIFGDLIYTYWHFKIEKIFKKTAKVKTIKEIGVGHSDKICVEKLGTHYSLDFKKLKKFNIKSITFTIQELEKELGGYTPKHPEYREKIDTIWIFKRMLSCANKLSPEEIEKCNEDIRDYLEKPMRFKIGDSVIYEGDSVTHKGEKAIIEGRRSVLREIKNFMPKLSYAIKFKNGDWYGSIPETELKKDTGGKK